MFLIVMSFVVLTCAAPQLDDYVRQRQKQYALSEVARWEYEKELGRFIDQLRAKESPDWTVINEIGCMGWFQFSPATLRSMGYGYITPERFKKDPGIFPPEMQVSVLKELIRLNEATLKNYMSYIGVEINGVMITRSGLIAGAHLGGAGGVIEYLTSFGNTNNSDMFNTSIQDYISNFQGFNI